MSVASIYSAGLGLIGGVSPFSGSAALGPFQPVAAVSAVGGCDCGQPDCPICGPALQASTDQIELSPVALEELSSSAQPTSPTSSKSAKAMSDEERAEVEELKQIDREVRAHEQAHQAAAGANAGGATFEYQTGPDGKRYAVAGEVPIDISTVPGDPEATIRKMEQVRAAALAPADPSSQDQAVAAQAMQLIQEARSQARNPDEETRAMPTGSSALTETGSNPNADGVRASRDSRFNPPRSAAASVIDTYA